MNAPLNYVARFPAAAAAVLDAQPTAHLSVIAHDGRWYVDVTALADDGNTVWCARHEGDHEPSVDAMQELVEELVRGLPRYVGGKLS